MNRKQMSISIVESRNRRALWRSLIRYAFAFDRMRKSRLSNFHIAECFRGVLLTQVVELPSAEGRSLQLS